GVNVSDGVYTNLTNFAAITPSLPSVTAKGIVYQYAVKHNPFAYFQNIQEGTNPKLSYAQMADFGGAHGLFADLGAGIGAVPNYAFIAPNQCND
ncbi:hypothetical protein, partial [Escherichia coli]